MEVIRAKSAGFCFGVKRAVETVYEQVEIEKEKQIYTYGPIIHNAEVVKDMEAHGVKVLNSEEAILLTYTFIKQQIGLPLSKEEILKEKQLMEKK